MFLLVSSLLLGEDELKIFLILKPYVFSQFEKNAPAITITPTIKYHVLFFKIFLNFLLNFKLKPPLLTVYIHFQKLLIINENLPWL